jgi:hypothetical protein
MIDDSDPSTLSGVKVSTSTRGFDVAVHAYVGCSPSALRDAGDLAMDEYARVTLVLKAKLAEANNQGAAAFAAEVQRRSAA